jgi:MFS family permease
MVALLRQRDVALVWLAGLVSLLGDSALAVALPYAVYQRTGSPAATGALVLVQSFPQVLLGAGAGVVVDRLDRRRTLVLCDLTQAGLLLLLLVALAAGWLWVVYPVAFAQAAVAQFFHPARSALVAQLVPEDRLLTANALDAATVEAIRLVGPPLGGALLVAAGLAGAAVADAVTFLLSAAALALVRAPVGAPRRAPGARRLLGDWLDGLRRVRRDPTLAALFAVVGLVSVGQGLWGVAWVVWVADVLRGGPVELGWLLTARGIGGLIGGAIASAVGATVAPARLIGAGLAVWAVLLLVLLHVPWLPLVLALQGLAGVPAVLWAVAHRTLLQRSVPDRYRGRVFGALGATAAAVGLGGTGVAGAAAGPVGARPLLDAACGLFLTAGLVAFLSLPAAADRTSAAATESPSRPKGRL